MYVHWVVDNLAMGETQPVQVVQEVTHTYPELHVVLVTITVIDHLLEHEFATFPFRFSYNCLQDHVILFLVHCVVDGLT